MIPSPNQKINNGLYREKWVLNPSATAGIHLKMYEFLGALMGLAIRTKSFLNLDLPSMVWKQLIDIPLTRQDLDNIDRISINCLDKIVNTHHIGVTEENFEDYFYDKFITYLSDSSMVELVPGGEDKSVNFKNRKEYARLVEETRLNESKVQAEALRRGLNMIVPKGLLNIITW